MAFDVNPSSSSRPAIGEDEPDEGDGAGGDSEQAACLVDLT